MSQNVADSFAKHFLQKFDKCPYRCLTVKWRIKLRLYRNDEWIKKNRAQIGMKVENDDMLKIRNYGPSFYFSLHLLQLPYTSTFLDFLFRYLFSNSFGLSY